MGMKVFAKIFSQRRKSFRDFLRKHRRLALCARRLVFSLCARFKGFQFSSRKFTLSPGSVSIRKLGPAAQKRGFACRVIYNSRPPTQKEVHELLSLYLSVVLLAAVHFRNACSVNGRFAFDVGFTCWVGAARGADGSPRPAPQVVPTPKIIRIIRSRGVISRRIEIEQPCCFDFIEISGAERRPARLYFSY